MTYVLFPANATSTLKGFPGKIAGANHFLALTHWKKVKVKDEVDLNIKEIEKSLL